MCRFLVVGFFMLQVVVVFAQGQIDSLPKAFTRNEHTVGGVLYTNGWGLGYAYGKMKKAKLKTLYSVDFAIVHDPKEIKTTNPASSDNNRFVYGKTNFLLNLHFTYGKLHRLYEKKDVGGIEIRYFYKLGPSFGFQKPIYYRFGVDSVVSVEKFTNATHQLISNIEGKASFFKGFDEINVIPGVHANVGVSFEFGKQDLLINAVEGGISIDVFVKKIELMANEYSQFAFPSLYLSLRFGKIVDPRIKKTNTKQH